MSDTTPSWGPPPGPPGPTPPGGDAPTQPAEPAGPPTQVGPTAPGGPAGPPPTPTTPGGGGKRGVPMPAFVALLVVLVAALAFGIVSFLGKNSESDDNEEAQQRLSETRAELQSARDQISSLEDELSGSQQTGEALSDLLGQAAGAADDLKSCADAARGFASAFIDAVPAIVTSGEVPTGLSDAATQADDVCATADGSYEDLIDIFAEINQ